MSKYIFRVDFTDDYHHRIQTYGGMDSEYSHTTREPHSEYILSFEDDIEFVEWNWKHRNKFRKLGDDPIEFTRIGYANAEYRI